jgi:hypothetical protein
MRVRSGMRTGVWVAITLVAVAIVGALLAWPRVRAAGDAITGRNEQQPTPPPPSDKMPDAPGPDNNIRELGPTNQPPQPASPIKSETDPSKKPKGGG